ncbi:MAG TPA: Gfo/Idh/MocA family oxidoreductase [Planctomycetota bacterium]|nr:Gfo/Idh/MocA family oxidoreductase [Planctomycetota bacterium]
MSVCRVRTGIIGCGNISKAYILTAQSFPILELAAVADIDVERAKAKALEFNVPRGCSVEALLTDKSIELVINLTIPKAHCEVALAALKAGKHVFNEKPLGATVEEGRRILEAASAAKLRVGCAPGTFLGGGLQTCRQLIDSGAIGRPLAATAFMTTPGHERWHPSPEFYYEHGGGPMLDMGPYYITALAQLLGPVKNVCGSATIVKPERTITSEPKKGKKIIVETPDHVTGVLEFSGGAVATIMTSFAIWHAHLPRIEIYGTDGTLSVPDPNTLKGPVSIRMANDGDWKDVGLTHGHNDGNKWGIGVADLAYAIRSGRPHRASGENAYHVLEVMHSFFTSAKEGRRIEITSPFTRPAPLPRGLAADALDE